jgi:hypothetical protein
LATDRTPLRRSTRVRSINCSQDLHRSAGRRGVVFTEGFYVVSLAGVTCWCVVKGDVIGRYAEGVSPLSPCALALKIATCNKTREVELIGGVECVCLTSNGVRSWRNFLPLLCSTWVLDLARSIRCSALNYVPQKHRKEGRKEAHLFLLDCK